MRVGLVVPCYIDVFYPEVGIAALELLEKLGVEVEYPFDQTCCGQPMANSGCESDARAYDIVEFLHDVMQVKEFPWAEFRHKIALHTSCSAIRGIFMQSMSERVHDPKFSKPKDLLQSVKGIEFAEFERPDECCGFGGTFSVTEEAVAAKMGYDKLGFVGKTDAEYIVSSDMSRLMHLQGCAHRIHKDVKFRHLVQILNGNRE